MLENENVSLEPETTEEPTQAKVSLRLPTAEELLSGRPPVQEVTVEYEQYGFTFTLRQIIDANIFADIGKQAGNYANVDFTNPLTQEEFRLDFQNAYAYCQLRESLIDPQNAKKKPYSVKQLVEIGCIHGPLIMDLKWRAMQLNELDGRIDALKKG